MTFKPIASSSTFRALSIFDTTALLRVPGMVGRTPFASKALAPTRTIVLLKIEVGRAFLIAHRLTLARSAADLSTLTRVLQFLAFSRELALAFLLIKVIALEFCFSPVLVVVPITITNGSALTATRVPIPECGFGASFNFGAGLQAPAVS